jgi:benzoyl-CoA reductase subunit C
MATIDVFREIAKDPASVAAKWKARGKKVVGYRCIYVPEEIIAAAGMLPYPLYGTPEPVRLADSYFQPCTCEYVRNLFDLALDGKLGFLDHLSLANTCDVLRRLCDIWGEYVDDTPVYMLNNPQRLLTESNRSYYLEELARFRTRMEDVSGEKITDARLSDAIGLHNETRRLMKGLYALRRADPPLISGAEALDVSMAVSVMPRDEANPLLRQLLSEIESREVEERLGSRILVTGSLIDDPALIQMVEDEGGVVVADDLCNSTRWFWHQVEEDGDPLEALYRFHNARPLCACMHPSEARLDYVLGLADEFEVDAAIYFNLKYCHPFLYEAPLLRKALEARDIPTTILEVGHDMSGHGQLRTRIQAFIEMVEL